VLAFHLTFNYDPFFFNFSQTIKSNFFLQKQELLNAEMIFSRAWDNHKKKRQHKTNNQTQSHINAIRKDKIEKEIDN
jgi:hypothetical protein